ncbi:oxaloacetate decarboxylase [Saprospiraceae bacterium]|nr:oxaloacetate decarboxylase [Saprospiraceae bacterium]
MRRKEIKLCLVYRDMWQSAGKYVPRVDQLCEVAPAIIQMGCFHRVETNGGGFEQVNLLFGENPNIAVRRWTQAFNDAGIQTQMLERGLNGIRMSPVPKDVRKLMFAVKKKQGTDISRSFDGLNNPQNLELSFQYAKEGGMIAQGALSITHSPLHTAEYYIDLANKYIELGAEEICIKDMAGIGRPVTIGKIVAGIRKTNPDIIIQYHGHSTPGFSVTSSLEAARNGADIIDVGMQPLSWGTGHADLLTIHAMLEDAGFSVAPINMDAYMEVRQLTQKYMDDFLGVFINPQNRNMNSLLIGPGLPGGMMGSLMADLENNIKSLNRWLTKNNKPNVTQDEMMMALFKEVEYAWPKLGYPPLVTPFSQYVKNVSLMNAMQLFKGKNRWSMIDENTWGMIMGKSGKLLGEIAPEIQKMADEQGREVFTGNPQDLYPDELDLYRSKMKEHNWSFGEDDEELMEYAMHPAQYEDYKSGKAKTNFEKQLQDKRTASSPILQNQTNSSSAVPVAAPRPTSMTVDVDGQKYAVKIDYGASETPQPSEKPIAVNAISPTLNGAGSGKGILAPLEGKFHATKDAGEKAVQVGDKIVEGQTIGYIEAMKVINAVKADKSGIVTAIVAKHGEDIEDDDVIMKVS